MVKQNEYAEATYVMALPGGRQVAVELPSGSVRWEGGEMLLLPRAVRRLDEIRALYLSGVNGMTATHLALLRRGLGMTQKELGQRLGVGSMTVSRWERGTLRPSAANVRAIERLRRWSLKKGVVLESA
jgi:DNA-binding transcriptional regulator YiaG